MCRTQLPVWQEYYQSSTSHTFELFAVAMDAQGPDRVRSFAEEAGATYPVLVDRENILGELFGFKVVPNVFIVDEAGVLRYQYVGGFSIKKPEVREELTRVLGQRFDQPSQPAPPRTPFGASAGLFAQGVRHYRAGRTAEAIEAWRQAWQLDPENFVIRKQIWAVAAPERFYPRIDFDWQKERLGRGE